MTLFSDFLRQLGVPHTTDYSDRQMRQMPFQTMFGLSKLLESYGIPCQGLKISDKTELPSLQPPFLADTPQGFVIVTSIDGDKVGYLTQGQSEQMVLGDFEQAWNGVVLLAFPDKNSREPGYTAHRTAALIDTAKKYVMWACVAALFLYLFISNGLYRSWATIGISLIDMAGLVFSFMLVQKSLNIHNAAADAVCGVLEKGGCDSILELKVSSFFGIFKWSEVGFTYFSVSLLALLMFPEWIGYLALCNACCLPYTVWSIWYQRFRAHRWCTLCVSVQTSLWLLFFCYLGGGFFKLAWPLHIEFFVLVATYITVLLFINRLSPMITKTSPIQDKGNETDTTTAA